MDEMEFVEDEVERKLNAVKVSGTNDAKWKDLIRNLNQKIEMVKNGWNGDELDRKKYTKLISEYKQFKKNEVQHFRFSSSEHTTAFGKDLSSTHHWRHLPSESNLEGRRKLSPDGI